MHEWRWMRIIRERFLSESSPDCQTLKNKQNIVAEYILHILKADGILARVSSSSSTVYFNHTESETRVAVRVWQWGKDLPWWGWVHKCVTQPFSICSVESLPACVERCCTVAVGVCPSLPCVLHYNQAALRNKDYHTFYTAATCIQQWIQ